MIIFQMKCGVRLKNIYLTVLLIKNKKKKYKMSKWKKNKLNKDNKNALNYRGIYISSGGGCTIIADTNGSNKYV